MLREVEEHLRRAAAPAGGKARPSSSANQKPGLPHADYNLGRAEMQMGNDEAAAANLQRATATESDPEVLQQAWFQLGIVYRRLRRMSEAQQAMATFQKLKNEEAENSQQKLKKFQVQRDQDASQPANSAPNPN